MEAGREFSWLRCAAWSLALGVHLAVLLPLTVPPRKRRSPALAGLRKPLRVRAR
jgi:hypothetical protein